MNEKYYMYFINFSKNSGASSEQEKKKKKKCCFRLRNLAKTNQVDLLRETLRKKLETTYKDIWDTPHAFQYLARCSCQYYCAHANPIVFSSTRFEKLKNVLHIEDMEAKHKRMINCFKVEMERLVQRLNNKVLSFCKNLTTKFYPFAKT